MVRVSVRALAQIGRLQTPPQTPYFRETKNSSRASFSEMYGVQLSCSHVKFTHDHSQGSHHHAGLSNAALGYQQLQATRGHHCGGPQAPCERGVQKECAHDGSKGSPCSSWYTGRNYAALRLTRQTLTDQLCTNLHGVTGYRGVAVQGKRRDRGAGPPSDRST